VLAATAFIFIFWRVAKSDTSDICRPPDTAMQVLRQTVQPQANSFASAVDAAAGGKYIKL
jgi:hypothetical protein